MQNAAVAITNFTEYFREERDVYVQNKSNTQVSLGFEMGMNRIESVLIPRSQDPINLTQLVPFSAIKNSADFRKMINRRPPVLFLLTEAEFVAYYKKKADARAVDVQTAIDEAHQGQAALQNRQAYTDKDKGPRKTIDDKTLEQESSPQTPEDVISARVVGLCSQVGDDVKAEDRIPGKQMLEELQSMELTRADLEFLMGRGYYKSIKKFAQQQLETKIENSPV